MTDNKNKKSTKPADEAPEVTTEEEVEREISAEELLADMPELRAPGRLRLRHKNRIMGVFFKAQREGILGSDDKDEDAGDGVSADRIEPMLELLADVDEFAESIAVDKEAYALWAEAHADNYDVFLAIMNRYVVALGESKSSAS